MNTQVTPLSVLVTALRSAKVQEARANAYRLEIERQIVSRFAVPMSGEGTHKDEEFSIKYSLTRTVATEPLQLAWESISESARKAFRWKAEIDLKQFKALMEFDQCAYRELAEFVTSKPAKPTITLKDE